MIIFTDRFIPDRFGAITLGFVSLIRPKYKDDTGLIAHENVHQNQFWRSLGLLPLLYLVSKTQRLKLEVEAYKEQMKWYPDDRSALFASFLVTKYGLDITQEEAMKALKCGILKQLKV